MDLEELVFCDFQVAVNPFGSTASHFERPFSILLYQDKNGSADIFYLLCLSFCFTSSLSWLTLTPFCLIFDNLIDIQLSELHQLICQVNFLRAHNLHLLLQILYLVDCSLFLLIDYLRLLFVLFAALEKVPCYSVKQILSVHFGSVQLLDFVHIIANPNWQWLQLF